MKAHAVELSLEESGILCNLLMFAIVPLQETVRRGEGSFAMEVAAAQLVRYQTLWDKLAKVNEELMMERAP
jgi:hypothetical protein